jgi:putative colanic acid biosynthesis UDP-glucose lipid carrier transferase
MAEINVHVGPGSTGIGHLEAPDATRPRTSLKFDNFVRACAAAEAASVILAAVISKYLYIDLFLAQDQAVWLYLLPAPLLAVTLYLFMKQAGLYETTALTEPVVGYGKLWGALAMSLLVLLGTLYILKSAEWYSRGWFLTWFALSAVALVTVRVAAKKRIIGLVSTGRLSRRVAIFGTLDFITTMKADIESSDPSIQVDGLYLAKPAVIASSEVPFDGGLAELKSALSERAFDSVIIGLPAQDTARIQAAVSGLASYSTELLLCTELEPYPVVVHGSRNFGQLRTNVVNLVPLSENHGFLKTSLDYAAATVGLICLAPFLALVALAIKIDSPGPVFFRQRRYGQNNQIFRIFKFRTMTVTEDDKNVKQAERNDLRVTRVGRILRSTSIDELPQLINVLTGDMSIVGPRPHALAHDQLFEEKLDLFSRRRRVRPGLTGWAQVHGFRGETRTTEDIRSRMQHDLYYIDNWSIWLDIEIITRTVFVLFRGAY